MFGLGGVNAELFDQVLLLPIELDIAAMTARIAGSRAGCAAAQRRRIRASALDRLPPILAGLQQLILAAGRRIESVDLNPVIVTKDNDLLAVDALIVRRKAP